MNEQAPAGGLGGDVVVETWHGLTRADIEDRVQHKGFFEVRLGRIATDVGDFIRDRDSIEADLNIFLCEFGINPQEWANVAIKLHSYDPSVSDKFKENIIRMRKDRSLGVFLADHAAHDLDIEGLEDGIGGVDLALMLSPSLMAIVHAGGDFWTTRAFVDPHTSRMADETNDRDLLNELEKQGSVKIDSRADFQLEFLVQFSVPETNS